MARPTRCEAPVISTGLGKANSLDDQVNAPGFIIKFLSSDEKSGL